MSRLPSTGRPRGEVRRPPSPEDIRAAEALVAGYRGGACMIRPDGTLLAANVRGSIIETLLQGEDAPGFLSLLKKAADQGEIAGAGFNVPGGKGEGALEITIVPQPGRDSLTVLIRDQSAERNLRTALVDSRQRYKDLVEVSSDFAWEVGPEKTFIFVSPRGALGYAAEQLVGRAPEDFISDPEAYDPIPFATKLPIENMEVWMQCADNSTACMIVSCLPLFDENDLWQGARGVCRDITEARDRETALANSRNREQVLNYIVSSIRDEVDPNNMLAVAAESAARSVGAAGCNIYRVGEGKKLEVAAAFGNADMVRGLDTVLTRLDESGVPVEAEAGEWQILLAATRYRQPVNGAICIWKKGIAGGWTDEDVALIADVANQVGIAHEQVANHERIVKLSRTDSLTGLLNRRAFFEDDLPRRLKRLKHNNKGAAIFYIDLDNFKPVNDIHGHDRGDEALIEARDLLLEHSRPGDAVVRLGGDEFVIWFDELEEDVAKKRAEKLALAGKRLLPFSGDEANPLSFSIGIAMYDPASGESLDDLMSRADAAMYRVKNTGKGNFAFAAPLESSAADSRASLKAEEKKD